jgi:hypothetical protein
VRHLPLAVEIWGAFLIIVGVALLVFNKRWATLDGPDSTLPPSPELQVFDQDAGG